MVFAVLSVGGICMASMSINNSNDKVWFYRYCPWIAHTNLLAKYHRATVQEERQVTYTPKFGPEAFHLGVERFCCCIC